MYFRKRETVICNVMLLNHTYCKASPIVSNRVLQYLEHPYSRYRGQALEILESSTGGIGIRDSRYRSKLSTIVNNG